MLLAHACRWVDLLYNIPFLSSLFSCPQRRERRDFIGEVFMAVGLSSAAAAAAAAALDSTPKLAGFVFLLVATTAALLFPFRWYL